MQQQYKSEHVFGTAIGNIPAKKCWREEAQTATITGKNSFNCVFSFHFILALNFGFIVFTILFQRIAAAGDGFARGLTVDKILGATRLCLPTREIFYLIKFKGKNDAELISSRKVNVRCPQILIEFFEGNMKIRKECVVCPQTRLVHNQWTTICCECSLTTCTKCTYS